MSEIFSHRDRRWPIEKWAAPSYEDLQQFAALVADSAGEEAFQLFFERMPSILAGAVNFAGDDSLMGMISKPQVGESFADFAVFVVTQGGAYLTLVEIEKPHSALFTRDGKLGGDLRSADHQIATWKQYVRRNIKAFVVDKVEQLCSVPLYSEARSGSFRTRPEPDIRNAWRVYGGYDYECVHYLAVCGRWSQLSDRDRKRFLSRSTDPDRPYDLRTYAQLARDAFINLYMGV